MALEFYEIFDETIMDLLNPDNHVRGVRCPPLGVRQRRIVVCRSVELRPRIIGSLYSASNVKMWYSHLSLTNPCSGRWRLLPETAQGVVCSIYCRRSRVASCLLQLAGRQYSAALSCGDIKAESPWPAMSPTYSPYVFQWDDSSRSLKL